jgi:trehalose synthase
LLVLGVKVQPADMALLKYVQIPARAIEPMAELYGRGEMQIVRNAAARLATALRGRIVWNINSTAQGGGVAELLRSMVGYARATGIDCRWAVIGGPPEFFQFTKALHNAMHGAASGERAFGDRARAIYERVCADNAAELRAQVRPADVAILHDPQTLGLAPVLSHLGVHMIWRCHIGTDEHNETSRAAFRFLEPYLANMRACVFTRPAYVPDHISLPETRIIVPTIDPLSAKNQPMTDDVARAILVHTGLFEGPPPQNTVPAFALPDGSTSRVDRAADVIRLGRAYASDVPLVVQISRWDRLKDHLGVLDGFAEYLQQGGIGRLLLVGPNVNAVADDPEGAEVFDDVLRAYRALPHGMRAHVELANLPMADADENAAIVNALQRSSTVIIQKSLQEGFGLTVSEAMWKAKPVIATRVGGIQDQIEHDVSGFLIDDPRDRSAFAAALQRVLSDPPYAARLGSKAKERVRERFLSLRSLYAYADLISDILERGARGEQSSTAVS